MATEEDRPRIELNAHMMTDVGVVRDHNEDAAYVDEQLEFFLVADGMGGHAAGEVAGNMAVERVREGLEEARDLIQSFTREPTDEGRKSLVSVIEQSVRTAHRAVYDRGTAESDKQGMGTTLDVVVVAGAEAFVAHVGDSRTYLVREGRAAQVTTDHTVAEVLVIEGKLSLEEAQMSPLRTILVNAIGVSADVGVEMAHITLRTGDRLLLCSDGLHDYFPLDEELAEHMEDKDPETALTELVDLAKSRGGHDNITGVLLDVVSVPPEMIALELAEDQFAHEPTGVQKLSDGVPHEVSRDDTLPVERRAEEEQEAEDVSPSGPSRDEDTSDARDLKTTVRMKPVADEDRQSSPENEDQGVKGERKKREEEGASESSEHGDDRAKESDEASSGGLEKPEGRSSLS